MGIGSAGKKIKLKVADLKKSLPPGLRPATAVELLRARIAMASERAKRPQKSRVSGRMIAEGKVGTRYSDWRILDLKKIAPSRNSNADIAKKVLAIHEGLRTLSFEIPADEHQALVNAANKTVKASLRNQAVTLTVKEQKAIDFYYRSVSR